MVPGRTRSQREPQSLRLQALQLTKPGTTQVEGRGGLLRQFNYGVIRLEAAALPSLRTLHSCCGDAQSPVLG